MLERNLRPKLFDHIRANARAKNISLDTIGGYIEQVHALISLGSDQTIAKAAQLIKGESSHWINQNSLTRIKFEWQEEYFAISVGNSMLEDVRVYIRGQEEHHRNKSFAEEYQQLLQKHGFSVGGLKSP